MYNIKWQQKDYLRLGKAVANFNKKVNKLQQEADNLYLPELKNYKELKENILTRAELNRVINSLRRFNKEDAENIVVLEGGERLSKWEKGELDIAKSVVIRRLNKELQQEKEASSFGMRKY